MNHDDNIHYSLKGIGNMIDLIEKYGTIPPTKDEKILKCLEESQKSKKLLEKQLNEHIVKIQNLKFRLILIVISSVLLIIFAAYFFFHIGMNYHDEEINNRVYVTSTGNRYHLYDCSYIDDNHIKPISIEEAQNQGYEACHRCNPDRLLK